MLTTREAILGVDDLGLTTVKVPEWGNQEVMIRGMTGKERELFDREYDIADQAGLRARIVAMSVCDENGKFLFSLEDLDELSTKSAGALERIGKEALKINGLAGSEAAEGN